MSWMSPGVSMKLGAHFLGMWRGSWNYVFYIFFGGDGSKKKIKWSKTIANLWSILEGFVAFTFGMCLGWWWNDPMWVDVVDVNDNPKYKGWIPIGESHQTISKGCIQGEIFIISDGLIGWSTWRKMKQELELLTTFLPHDLCVFLDPFRNFHKLELAQWVPRIPTKDTPRHFLETSEVSIENLP